MSDYRIRVRHVRGLRRASLVLVPAVLLAVAAHDAGRPAASLDCSSGQLSFGQVAALRGVSADHARILETVQGLTAPELCAMSELMLQRSIRKATMPKPDSPGEYLEWRRRSLRDESGAIDPQGLFAAQEHVDRMKAAAPPASQDIAGISRNSWTSIGPGNVGGRVRTMVIHPTSPNTMLIGSVGGGIWRTTNGGTSWTPVDDFMANLAVSTLVMKPGNPNEVYAGTGEGFFNLDGIQGAGIFKSTNGGTTWSQLPSTSTSPSAGLSAVDFHYVNRLAMSPNGQTLLAATRTGIFRSTNGGTSFTRATMAGGGAIDGGMGIMDIDFHPTDSNRAVASTFLGTALYSTNGGATWTLASGLPGDIGDGFGTRLEIAYAPSSPEIVYAAVDLDGGSLYKSTDGGQSFTEVFDGFSDTVNPYDAGGGSQGWYDNLIWVSPTDPNFVVWGGIDLFRSTDGGLSFTRISRWQNHNLTNPTSAHGDQHIAVAHPGFNGTSNRIVFFGNDGGIYKAADIATVGGGAPPYQAGWQELNNGLTITQFYGGAGHAATGRITGGTQDNGTLFYNPALANASENWRAAFGGDGGFSAYDSADANYFYGEYAFAQIHRNTTGGVSFSQYIYDGITDAGTEEAEFIAAFRLDPNQNNRMLVATTRLWRSNNVKATVPTWEVIKPSLGGQEPDHISAIGIAPSNSNTIYVGHNSGRLYRTFQGTAAAATVSASWTAIDNNGAANPLPNRRITRITIDPNNTNVVYVTFGGFSHDNVYKSVNGGGTWVDITGPAGGPAALPHVPVRSLVVNPANSNWIYVGTEVGIFASTDGGATWGLPHDGPSNVSVDELFFMGSRLVAVTHGRGMFSTAVGDPPVVSPIANLVTASGVPVSTTYTVTDPDTPLELVTVSATSSNTTLLPNANIATSGAGENRLVTLQPVPGRSGSATVTITASDGATSGSSSFLLTVTAPPTISAIGSRSTGPGMALAVPFRVSDPDTPAANLTVTASSSNEAVLPQSGIVLGGTGNNRTVTLTPVTFGITTVTLTASDGTATTSRAFLLTVTEAPSNLTAVVVGNLVTLSWFPSTTPGVTGYVVEAGVTSGSASVSIPVGNVTMYQTSAPSGVFFVRVRAMLGGAPGTASNEVEVRVGTAALPGAPSNLLANVNGSLVNLAWHNSPLGGTRTGLILQAALATSPDAVIAQLPLPANAETFAINAPAGSYSLRVVAAGISGVSEPSNSVVVNVPGTCGVPDMPQNLTAQAVGRAVHISWELGSEGSPAPTHYVFEAGFAPGAADAVVLATASRVITATAPPGTYHLRVRAVSACGDSANTQDVALVVP